MSQKAVIFKGSKNGIMVILDGQKPFEDIISSIKHKLERAGNFFSGTSLNIGFRGRLLDVSEKQQLSNIIQEVVGDDAIIDFETPGDQSVHYAGMFEGIEEGVTKFYKGTIRSGQSLNAEGNLIVLGDINPGAQVIANGNIVVMGSLRGIVHAGYNGNTKAIVAALNLQPTQLRIANVISRSPDDDERHHIIPEIACIRGDKIYIDYYLPKKNL